MEAVEHLVERVRLAGDWQLAASVQPLPPQQAGVGAAQCGVDFTQRRVLGWNGRCLGANKFIERQRQGLHRAADDRSRAAQEAGRPPRHAEKVSTPDNALPSF